LLFFGHCFEQALYAVAARRIPDILENGPRTVTELAAEAACDEFALHAVLRLLATFGVFVEIKTGVFANTPASRSLREDSGSALSARVQYYGNSKMWPVWGTLDRVLETGCSGVELIHGLSFYSFLAENADIRTAFNSLMSRGTAAAAPAIVSAYDFAEFDTIIDIGGGSLALVSELARRYPELRLAVFDSTLAEVDERQIARVTMLSGDMRDEVPNGYQIYLLKSVLSDWPDSTAIRILRNCAVAMPPDGRILVVEVLRRPGPSSAYEAAMDVQSLLLFGAGGRRSEAEYRALLHSAGLRLTRTLDTSGDYSIMEATRRH
jgi:hypothetical protein